MRSSYRSLSRQMTVAARSVRPIHAPGRRLLYRVVDCLRCLAARRVRTFQLCAPAATGAKISLPGRWQLSR